MTFVNAITEIDSTDTCDRLLRAGEQSDRNCVCSANVAVMRWVSGFTGKAPRAEYARPLFCITRPRTLNCRA
ncbi:hypothetical protein KCP69_21450 [Salmonella enterica subsp. enterica]|nr:hypothetical protein KCP69_21450 [Salmonella enterica subsp. enterica]